MGFVRDIAFILCKAELAETIFARNRDYSFRLGYRHGLEWLASPGDCSYFSRRRCSVFHTAASRLYPASREGSRCTHGDEAGEALCQR